MSTLTISGAPSTFLAYQNTSASKFGALLGFMAMMLVATIAGIALGSAILTAVAGIITAVAVPVVAFTELNTLADQNAVRN